MHPDLAHLLASGGALRRADHPKLANPIRHALAARHVVPLLAGTYALEANQLSVAHALQLWDADAVLTGATAAKLFWWTDLQHDAVHAMSRRRNNRDVPLLKLTRGTPKQQLVHVPEELGLRLAHPAWSVLDMIDDWGADVIDEALRRRAIPLKALWWALRLLPNRRGNQRRRRLLIESRAEPWSALEREAHTLLFAAGITGWRTNRKLVLPTGEVRFLDICFDRQRFGIELDGEEHHRTSEAFHNDRYKDMWAARIGWRVVRFTRATLDELVPMVRDLELGSVA